MTSMTEIINAQLDGWADLGIVRFPPAPVSDNPAELQPPVTPTENGENTHA